MVLVPWFESISFLSTDGRFPQIFIWQAMPNLPGQSMINHYSVYTSFGPFLMTKREDLTSPDRVEHHHPFGAEVVEPPLELWPLSTNS